MWPTAWRCLWCWRFRTAAERDFESIREDLGNSYTVTYYPQPNPNEGFRKIAVEITTDALIRRGFRFVTVDGERPIYEQHKRVRKLFQENRRTVWGEWNIEALTEWLEWTGGVPEVSRES